MKNLRYFILDYQPTQTNQHIVESSKNYIFKGTFNTLVDARPCLDYKQEPRINTEHLSKVLEARINKLKNS